MSAALRRRIRRLLRRAARHPRLEPLAWRIRARRRGRTAPPPRPSAADRRARIALSPRIRAVESRLGELAAGADPIVAGPWRGNLELELLYWIPFLRWFVRRFGVDAARIAAVSRPGAGAWYAGVCGTYSATPDELGGRKLEPALLDEVCGEYRQERAPLVHVLDRLLYERVESSSLATGPETIVFWPGREEGPATFEPPADERLVVIDEHDREDAAALTAAVAGAGLLVGPWDGRLMLGPMLGVPTVALTGPSSGSPDLDLAHRAARALDSPLLLVDAGQINLVSRLAARVAG